MSRRLETGVWDVATGIRQLCPAMTRTRFAWTPELLDDLQRALNSAVRTGHVFYAVARVTLLCTHPFRACVARGRRARQRQKEEHDYPGKHRKSIFKCCRKEYDRTLERQSRTRTSLSAPEPAPGVRNIVNMCRVMMFSPWIGESGWRPFIQPWWKPRQQYADQRSIDAIKATRGGGKARVSGLTHRAALHARHIQRGPLPASAAPHVPGTETPTSVHSSCSGIQEPPKLCLAT